MLGHNQLFMQQVYPDIGMSLVFMIMTWSSFGNHFYLNDLEHNIIFLWGDLDSDDYCIDLDSDDYCTQDHFTFEV